MNVENLPERADGLGQDGGQRGQRFRLVLLWLLALVAVLVVPRWLPKPPLSGLAPSSRSVTAVGGELLRLTLATDEQYRLWTPLDDISPPMREAVLLYEDRWFYWKR